MNHMRTNRLLALLLLGSWLLVLGLATATEQVERLPVAASDEPHIRNKRGIFWDFFQKMVITKNLIVDQYTDTRNTLNDIYNTVNEQFSDPAPAKPTSQPRVTTEKLPSSDEDDQTVKTTTEGFAISRYELGRILGRNFRGVQRLAQIEFKDALNATHYNLQQYKMEADKQFANSVGVEKKNKLKSLGLG
ncbi:uncharacterized protein LOC6584915 isoform X2 [Drosophila mojavensis]|nr:uncharacterized protein LOC6584915 isoform X2 [Drosophila mojavensis]XP_015016704.1 uncharacterized protein LOC6584915 isoform X2 [Drosophila mojavensis]EDW07872.1 uncharacterized protein Dmoj_GI14617, isoform A [Drosophila mojavensis]KRF94252.1 uncharacterized protein Dmoj_GI14617, isoform B [Drosophila mojavensis]